MKAASFSLPAWADTLVTHYESEASNQFILYGNVHDRFLVPNGKTAALGEIKDFLLSVLLARFDVVLLYDLGQGLHAVKGESTFRDWIKTKTQGTVQKPASAIPLISYFVRYLANLSSIRKKKIHVAVILSDAALVVPATPGGPSHDVAALGSEIRSWTAESVYLNHPFVSFLIAENINDLNALLSHNPRALRVPIPLPGTEEIRAALDILAASNGHALNGASGRLDQIAGQFSGASLRSIESLLKIKEHQKKALDEDDLSTLKKSLVERDCQDLIEFLKPDRKLDDLYGMDAVKEWLRQDLALWRRNDVSALPKGYLLCGPVGTGKTFLVECLAGEAGLPVVKLMNFRDKWVGSTEGNLERIFRLIHALGRAFVFIDEADQALGRRAAGGTDSGLSGRIYSMMAEEMSRSDNRGKVIWILASSRPDLIEVDLKRPGRVDVKIPIFPTAGPEESFHLLQKLFARRNMILPDEDFSEFKALVPSRLTPGTAEALSVKAYRFHKTRDLSPPASLKRCLEDFQAPIPKEIMDFQIDLAVKEASDLSFVPASFRSGSSI